MTTIPEILSDHVTMLCGDCMELLPTLDSNSFDSFVSDPPYHLTSIVKRFGADNSAPAKDYSGVKAGATGAYARASAGFMGKRWDGGDIAFRPELWREVFRVLKPGAHLLAFGGTRTYHRMACAIEDAGFEVRDCVQWLYGSGFPKSLDVSRAIDRAAGAEREIVGVREYAGGHIQRSSDDKLAPPIGTFVRSQDDRLVSAPATDAAREWQGYGTALKPACELICLARKPCEAVSSAELHRLTGSDHWWSERSDSKKSVTVRTGNALHPAARTIVITLDKDMRKELRREERAYEPFETDAVAANVLKWGTGALNVDGCKIVGGPSAGGAISGGTAFGQGAGWNAHNNRTTQIDRSMKEGRWPANVITDGSDEVVGMFPDLGKTAGGYQRSTAGAVKADGWGHDNPDVANGFGDSGSAARFFYTAKADQDDRLGSKHPTVKPVDLKQYLVRLVTPKGGLVLDCFAGTGTTGEAAWREGMRAVLIEREPEYQDDIRRRMRLVLSGPTERKHESVKARGKPVDHGPLFGAAWGNETDKFSSGEITEGVESA